MLRRILIMLMVIMWHASGMAASHILDIRVSKYDPSTTRLVLDSSGILQSQYFFLTNPDRMVIDFKDVDSYKQMQTLGLQNSYIKKMRFGRPNLTTLRLVLELDQPVTVKQFQLSGDAKQRLVFDLKRAEQVQHEQTKKAQSVVLPSPILKHGRDITIIVDAGHGGKDPGAHGKFGSQEKIVVLEIAKELKRLIDQQRGMKAVLTRDGNYYIPLRHRLQKARQEKGDIFISIHADAFKNPQSAGASVYALSLKGASSEAARWLAEKENYSELGQVDLSDKDDVLRSVLIDLSQTATISASLDLGTKVLSNLQKIAKLHYPKVEQARFVVLKSPDIPSILVETGFISNPLEERRLNNPKYQKQLAQAIMQGITAYFRYRAPPGTWLAQYYGQYQELRT